MLIDSYPIGLRKGHLVISIHDRIWVFDTGSPLSFGESELRLGTRRHPLPGTIPGAGGKLIGVGDLSRMLECEVAGLIGNDVINLYDHELDLDAGKLELHEEGTLADVGRKIPVKFQRGCPTLKCRWKKHEFHAVFDTGAPHSHLASDLCADMPAIGSARDSHPLIGEFEAELVHPSPAIKASGVIVSERWLRMPTAVENMLKLVGWKGIVGTELLLSRRVRYLPSRGLLLVRLGKREASGRILSTGMVLSLLGLTALVLAANTSPDSAEIAGFLAGGGTALLVTGLCGSIAGAIGLRRMNRKRVMRYKATPTAMACDTPPQVVEAGTQDHLSEIRSLTELVAKITRERDVLKRKAEDSDKAMQQVGNLWTLLDFNRMMRAEGKMVERQAIQEVESEVEALLEYLHMHPYDIPAGTPIRSLPDGSYVIADKTAATTPDLSGTVKSVRSRAVIRTPGEGPPVFIIPAKIAIYT